MGCGRSRAREAAAVKRLARRLGVAHRTLRWRGRKPTTGLQEAARARALPAAGASGAREAVRSMCSPPTRSTIRPRPC